MQVSVPGSLMWFGEHAVLHGATGIATAINRRMFLQLIPRLDRLIFIQTDQYGTYQATLDDFQKDDRFRFILKSIELFLPQLKYGFILKINSAIDSQVGFGSSAAIVAGTIALLYRSLHHHPIAKYRLWQKSLTVIRAVQGFGSGGDLAASIYGGIIKYHRKCLKRIETNLPLLAIYCGYKKTTQEVVHLIEQRTSLTARYPLYRAIDKISRHGWRALKRMDLKTAGQLMNQNRLLQQQLGVEDQTLADILNFLQQQPNILGAKISGSGLGDCVLAIGQFDHRALPKFKTFSLQIDRGLSYV